MSSDAFRLRARLEAIEEQILLLKEERRHVQSALARVVYPVLSLPVEITAEIFVQSLDGPKKPDFMESPLVLTRVCSTWRKIAIKTPQLWGYLQLDFAKSDRPVYRQPSHALVNTWLARGGSTPLNMDVNHVSTDLSPLLCDILRSTLRWKDMALSLPLPYFMTEFEAKKDVPVLESLTLDLFPIFGSRTDTSFCITAFREAPKLRAVQLTNCITRSTLITPSTIILPWGQLTHFSAEGYSPETCHKVLHLARALVKCSFRDIIKSSVTPDSLPPLRLEHMEVLDIAGSVALLTHCLDLPKLQQLKFDDWDRGGWDSPIVSDLCGLASRSPEITRFVCVGGALPDFQYGFEQVKMLAAMPKLTHLELFVLTGNDNSIIYALRDSPSFLPHIRSIKLTVTFSVSEISNVDYDVLADVLTARFVETFSLDWMVDADRPGYRGPLSIGQEAFKVGATERLLELKQQGRDIHIGMGEAFSFV
ncbi:hypothetical protein DFH09DRAFT_448940 [Mycena vulgaris]|nr:hypothetical protein DFH09DRAFT_448940 [Mycena vulgaris]